MTAPFCDQLLSERLHLNIALEHTSTSGVSTPFFMFIPDFSLKIRPKGPQADKPAGGAAWLPAQTNVSRIGQGLSGRLAANFALHSFVHR